MVSFEQEVELCHFFDNMAEIISKDLQEEKDRNKRALLRTIGRSMVAENDRVKQRLQQQYLESTGNGVSEIDCPQPGTSRQSSGVSGKQARRLQTELQRPIARNESIAALGSSPRTKGRSMIAENNRVKQRLAQKYVESTGECVSDCDCPQPGTSQQSSGISGKQAVRLQTEFQRPVARNESIAALGSSRSLDYDGTFGDVPLPPKSEELAGCSLDQLESSLSAKDFPLSFTFPDDIPPLGPQESRAFSMAELATLVSGKCKTSCKSLRSDNGRKKRGHASKPSNPAGKSKRMDFPENLPSSGYRKQDFNQGASTSAVRHQSVWPRSRATPGAQHCQDSGPSTGGECEPGTSRDLAYSALGLEDRTTISSRWKSFLDPQASPEGRK